MKSRHEVWKEREATLAQWTRDLDAAGKLLVSTDAAAGHCKAMRTDAAPSGRARADVVSVWQRIRSWFRGR